MGRRERAICLILLIAVIAWSVINLIVWLRFDTRPPRWDESGYLTLSLKYYEALTSGGVGAFVSSLLKLERERPPLVPALAVPAYLLFGRSTDVAFAVHVLAFIALILAVYGLGARLASRWCGLLAAFLVSTYPSILSLSRIFLQDFCDAMFVAASLYLLIRTEGFSRRKFALAWGAVIGLGLLCRAFFPIFVIGPLTVSAYIAWRESQLHLPTQDTATSHWWINVGLALLIGAAVAAPWYLVNLLPLLGRSLSAAYGTLAVGYGPSNPLTLRSLVYYFVAFVNVHLTLVGLGIFLLAMVILVVKRSVFLSAMHLRVSNPAYGLWILLSAVLLPYLFFSTLPSQDSKNIVPILPAMAVITAWGLTLVHTALLKKTLIGVIIAWSLFQCWIGTYGVPGLPQQVGVSPGWNIPPLLLWHQGFMYPHQAFILPRREHWPIHEILSRITGGSKGFNKTLIMARPAVVAILPDHPLFNSMNFWYTAVLQRLPVHVTHPGKPWTREEKEYPAQLLAADFAIIKVNSQTDEPEPPGMDPDNPHYAEMVAFVRSAEHGFVEIAPRFALPDGSQAVLYAASGGPIDNTVPQIQHSMSVEFNEQVELLGYDCEDRGQTSIGRAFLITYYWRALRKIGDDYRVFVHVMKETDLSFAIGWDHPPARGRYPTSFWQPGTIIKDRGLYFLPNDVLPGAYLLKVGLYHPATEERLAVDQASPGLALDDNKTRAAIGTIRVP